MITLKQTTESYIMNTLVKHTALSIKKLFNNDNYEFYIKNNKVNGNYDGASGFIMNKLNNKIVYISVSLYTYESNMGYMYRTAKTLKDYTGGNNNWIKDNEKLSENISLLLD